MEHQRLREWLKTFYKYEFSNLNEDYKNKMIDYVLDNNAKIFTADDVMAVDYCVRCGECCRLMHCNNYNEENHLCKQHNDDRWVICQTAPYGDPDFGLMLHFGIDCEYLTNFLIKYFNKVFSKAEELNNVKNKK